MTRHRRVVDSAQRFRREVSTQCPTCGTDFQNLSKPCVQCGSKHPFVATDSLAQSFVRKMPRNGSASTKKRCSTSAHVGDLPFFQLQRDQMDPRLLPTFSTGAFEQSLRAERRLGARLRRAADSAAQAVLTQAEVVAQLREQVHEHQFANGDSCSSDGCSSLPVKPPCSPVVAEAALMFVADVAKIRLISNLTWLQQLTDLRRRCPDCKMQSSELLGDTDQDGEIQVMLHECRRAIFCELNECREAYRQSVHQAGDNDWEWFPEVMELDRFMKKQPVMIWDPIRDNADARALKGKGGLPPWWSSTLAERIFCTLPPLDVASEAKEDTSFGTLDFLGMSSTSNDREECGDLTAGFNNAVVEAGVQQSRALDAEQALFWSKEAAETLRNMLSAERQKVEEVDCRVQSLSEVKQKNEIMIAKLKAELFDKETALSKAVAKERQGYAMCKNCGALLDTVSEGKDTSSLEHTIIPTPSAPSRPIPKKKKTGGGGGGFGGGGGGRVGGSGGNVGYKGQSATLSDCDSDAMAKHLRESVSSRHHAVSDLPELQQIIFSRYASPCGRDCENMPLVEDSGSVDHVKFKEPSAADHGMRSQQSTVGQPFADDGAAAAATLEPGALFPEANESIVNSTISAEYSSAHASSSSSSQAVAASNTCIGVQSLQAPHDVRSEMWPLSQNTAFVFETLWPCSLPSESSAAVAMLSEPSAQAGFSQQSVGPTSINTSVKVPLAHRPQSARNSYISPVTNMPNETCENYCSVAPSFASDKSCNEYWQRLEQTLFENVEHLEHNVAATCCQEPERSLSVVREHVHGLEASGFNHPKSSPGLSVDAPILKPASTTITTSLSQARLSSATSSPNPKQDFCRDIVLGADGLQAHTPRTQNDFSTPPSTNSSTAGAPNKCIVYPDLPARRPPCDKVVKSLPRASSASCLGRRADAHLEHHAVGSPPRARQFSLPCCTKGRVEQKIQPFAFDTSPCRVAPKPPVRRRLGHTNRRLYST